MKENLTDLATICKNTEMNVCVFLIPIHRYGVVLRELGMKVEAREKLLKSCELVHCYMAGAH